MLEAELKASLGDTSVEALLDRVLARGFAPEGAVRERDVFFRVLAAAAAGLLVRYLLEYGEVSNTRNFTAENVLFFLLTVPAGMTAAYHFLVKFLLPKSRGGGAQSAERRTSA